ncbi:MAG: hypothetical protein AAGD96_01635 [Chloroflexota bacterium]
MNRSQKRSITRIFFLISITAVALILVACGGSEPELPELESIEVLATPTSRPTTTPVPTSTPSPIPSEAQQGTESNTEQGSIIGVGEADQTEEVAVEELPEDFIEPEVVSINFRQQTINDWVEVVPPPGWTVSAGLDGLVLAQDSSRIPEVPFTIVRRWGNAISVGDWVAYVPDAVEERNSNVTIRMGGYDWEGVFLTTDDNSYRAFFAVTTDILPAYTILVYVPMDQTAITDEGFTREALLETWDINAGELNTILRRFLFS